MGLDPRAMLRQDRLLQEELGFPGHYVRAVSEWQTKDRYHVAAQGSAISDMDYDKWMSCYRDGRDEAGLGYRAIAFAHGRDLDKRQHFQRFSGLPFMSFGAFLSVGDQFSRTKTQASPKSSTCKNSLIGFPDPQQHTSEFFSLEPKPCLRKSPRCLRCLRGLPPGGPPTTAPTL